MNRASLQVNHDMQLVCVVITVALGIILFEVIPEKSIWSIPVTPADEHIIALPSSGGSSLLLMQKQGEERKALTKEQNYKKKYTEVIPIF
jgi:hypothetical protein